MVSWRGHWCQVGRLDQTRPLESSPDWNDGCDAHSHVPAGPDGCGNAGPSTRLPLAIVLVAVNLRVALASLPPLVRTIQADLTCPAPAPDCSRRCPCCCMGAFAPVSQRVAHRIGREATVGLVGLIGVLAAPGSAAVGWIALMGLGRGGGFALGLVKLVDYAPSPAAAARLSALVLCPNLRRERPPC